MLHQIVYRLLTKLIQQDLLLLKEESSVQTLAQDIVAAMPNAAFASHFGSWLSEQLLSHPIVEELFASDKELTTMLRDIGAE